MQQYLLPGILKAGCNQVLLSPPKDFRSHIRILVPSEGLIFINGIYINDAPLSELLGEIDGYNWSIAFLDKLTAEFLKEHNLVGKRSEDIDDYLDANDLSFPDPGRVDLPTIRADGKIRITGKFSIDCPLTLIGYCYK